MSKITRKLFTASQFTATQWNTSEDKANFANHFVRFLESDCNPNVFTKGFYNRLSMCFSHIAHFNRGGFFDTWFSSSKQKALFLVHCLNNGGYGDPSFTYSDVEKALKPWIISSGLVEKFRVQAEDELQKKEIHELNRLQEKYGKDYQFFLPELKKGTTK